ncbi:universal stress protein [Amycolatopsis anabasis]|uniref:universal stress protein n=1 Tax=Amycolatopsis anabasis TaxID=1840409 RepID=UPI001FE37561|nr:universal stress protein [Amycolatopsis anabasis]
MTAPIVIGVDGSQAALRAVRWATAEAARRRVPLRLVHAYGIPDAFPGETMPPKDWLDAEQARSRNVLRHATEAAWLADPKVSVASESALDAPVPRLLEESRSARMLVLGATGVGGFYGLLVGSVAGAVAAHARCPVAVVRGEHRADPPVVVGIDGSPLSEAATALAFEEAALRGTELVAVHSWSDADTAQLFSDSRFEFDFEPLRDTEERALAERLAGWREKYPEVAVRRVLVEDKPRHQLLEQSRRASLLVVGSRGRGGLRGLLLGSTSQALITHAECPVLIARSGEDG